MPAAVLVLALPPSSDSSSRSYDRVRDRQRPAAYTHFLFECGLEQPAGAATAAAQRACRLESVA